MADEDDVDVLGEFDLENLFTKDDGRLTCYDGMDVPSHWLLDTSAQPCWYTESKALSPEDLVPMATSWDDTDTWTQRERELLEKGLALFGRSWPRLAQYVGTKTAQQVKAYTTSISSNDGPDISALGFTEIIDDIQIPASIEEVIAVVSTAQPTVATPTSTNAVRYKGTGKRGRPPKNWRNGDLGRPKGKRGPKPKPNTTIVHSNKPPKLRKPSKKMVVLEAKDNKVCTIGEEEVIRIRKVDKEEDEDEEIDIDVEDDREPSGATQAECSEGWKGADGRTNGWAEVKMEGDEDTGGRKVHNRHQTVAEREAARKLSDQLRLKTHQDILELIYNIPPPERELLLDPFSPTNQEVEVHNEFFEDRRSSVKTPSRYLKIRNHIVDCWRSNKPAYVSKTSVRAGLKNCGDVNCVGRIHAFLEQIGAINFGCEQARYCRPIYAPSSFEPIPFPNAAKERGIRVVQPTVNNQAASIENGGYTISHREDGTTQMHVAAATSSKPKTSHGNQQIQLITCSKFDKDKPAPYNVILDISALAVMDLHAHATYCEVIGLLGGDYDPGTKVVSITRTQPCRASSSGVHCDMCPVSQTEASERLLEEGYSVVGWYHSHPAFSPNPSLQDIITQSSIQNYSRERPFVGFILSPHSVASTYRCVVVVSDSQEAATPYRLPVRLTTHSLDLAALERHLATVFDNLRDQGTKLRLTDIVNQTTIPISYLQKCVESVRYHMEQSGEQLAVTERSKVLQAIVRSVKDNM